MCGVGGAIGVGLGMLAGEGMGTARCQNRQNCSRMASGYLLTVDTDFGIRLSDNRHLLWSVSRPKGIVAYPD